MKNWTFNYVEPLKNVGDPLELGDSLMNWEWFYTILAINKRFALVSLKATGLAKDHKESWNTEEISIQLLSN